jgi:hypothetical protein
MLRYTIALCLITGSVTLLYTLLHQARTLIVLVP